MPMTSVRPQFQYCQRSFCSPTAPWLPVVLIGISAHPTGSSRSMLYEPAAVREAEIGPARQILCRNKMSASLIGHSGSSAFRLSATTVLMLLAGSCFSSESAPRPFHHGIRGRGGTIFWSTLPSDERQVQPTLRTHLIHRPARDIIPPLGGARVSSYWI